MRHNRYIIAQGLIGNDSVDQTGLDYTARSKSPTIIRWMYARFGPDSDGSSAVPADALRRYRKDFTKLDAEWFMPFLERMAQGEEVPIEEINSRHMELFGKELQTVPSPYPPQYDDEGRLKR